MGVGPTTSGSDSPFLSSMGAAPSSSTKDSPFLSSRTMIRGDCPNKVSRFDDSNVNCLENESVSSRDSSVCSSRRVGRPKKPSRKGIGGRKKQSECIEIDIENENVVINDEPIIFLAPDPPDMPVRQSIPVRQSERIKNRKLSITQVPIVQPIFSSKPNPITDNNKCLSTHEGFPCADTRARHTAEYYDSGDIGKYECHYCKALLLESEINQSHKSKFKVITSSLCCSCGTVTLPPYTEHPMN
uniref:Uncharacterized protein n=1 Tax=Meloidogyne enterolobii TaxID=390850 RepID=A0A6V7XGK5_MELEN|nr:unnamed protein product [Meloidogyne enterolobii]